MSDVTVDCSEDFSTREGECIPADWSGITGGVFRGAVGANVDILGVDLKLTEDLTIIAAGDLTIDGRIDLVARERGSGPFLLGVTPEPNFNFISLRGAVIVTKGSEIGLLSASQRGADFVNANGLVDATAENARDAGYVRISGVSIEIAGIVRGISGGSGGDAVQDRTSDTGALQKLANLLDIFQSATATGGRGGPHRRKRPRRVRRQVRRSWERPVSRSHNSECPDFTRCQSL